MSAERLAVLTVCAFLFSLITIPIFQRIAITRGWLDASGSEPLKIHPTPVPYVGGFGIVLGCALSLLLIVPYSSQRLSELTFILVGGLIFFGLGFYDDRYSVPPLVRFGVEIASAFLLVLGGLLLSMFNLPAFLSDPTIGVAATMFFLGFYVTGAINAVNMQDGLDGLAGGVVLISCIGFTITGMMLNQWLVMALSLALGGALIAFLIYNFHPATVFMGDSGSYFVGFMLATIALLMTSASGTAFGLLGAVLLVGLPVFDSAFAILRRAHNGRSPFVGDRSHFYDLLIQRGFGTRTVTLINYGLQLLFTIAGTILFLSGR